jgi:hypothetical protein
MKGGTSLRPDAAVNSALPRSLIVASSIDICYFDWRRGPGIRIVSLPDFDECLETRPRLALIGGL